MRTAAAATIAVLCLALVAPPAAGGGDGGGERAAASMLYLARTGLRSGFTYRYLQAIRSQGRWLGPDVGYLDFGDVGAYREIWAGGGGVAHSSERWLVLLEGFLAQASGTRARGETYLQPWILVGYTGPGALRGELVYLVYLPLDDAGERQHLLDRAKLEVDLGRWRVGAGYAGYQYGSSDWQHRPLLTATVEGGRAGDLEFWLQRMPDAGGGHGVQLHVRYALRTGP